ncbi:MAG: hypothetical protein IJ367_04085, partial [Clostridia bacterium]|nr:hypothetical protein [Clostridia bacterium]
KMLESALSAGAVVAGSITDSNIDYFISDTEDFLSANKNIRTYRGIVTGNENTHLKNPDSNLTDEQIAIDGVVYDTPGYVYATSLGKAVRYYVRDTKDGSNVAAYVEEDEKKNNLTKIDAEDIVLHKTTADSVYYTDENDKERHVDFEENITVIYNGKCYRGFGYLESVLPENGYIEALDNTGDGVCELLFVSTYRNFVIAAVDAYSGKITAKETGEVISVDLSDEDTKLYMHPDNRKTDLGKLRVGDVATVMESKGDPRLTTVYISRDTVSGQITECSDESGYLINGTYYECATDYFGPELKVGMQMTFRLDKNGDIVDIDSQNVESDAFLGLMTGIQYDFEAVDDSVSARIYTEDGAFSTFTLKFPVRINNRAYEKKDAEAVLELLSGGAKNDSGLYTVNEAYVVQYKLSGGEITSLYTGTGGAAGQLRIIGEGNSFFVRNGKMLGLEGASPSDYAAMKPGKTVIFTCPSAGELDEEDGYGILDKLTSDKEYTNSVTQYYQIAIDGYILYDFNNNEA